MFGLFKRKKADPAIFDSAEAAFDYACRNLENRILLEAVIPALVEEFVRVSPEGERYFRIRLANRHGGQAIEACTLKESSRAPSVGDLIGYKVVRYDPDMPPPFDLLASSPTGSSPFTCRARGGARPRASFPTPSSPRSGCEPRSHAFNPP
ncbi:hypothetical protein [Geobacter anodireducens]